MVLLSANTHRKGRQRVWQVKAGPKGATGSAGPSGPAGSTGTAGTPGNAGPQGPAGTPGTAGSQGPIGLTGPQGTSGISGLVAANYQQTILTYTGSPVTWTYAVPFASGVIPVIEAVVATAAGSATSLYNVQVVGNSTNTSVTLQVNSIPTATVSLTGLLSLTLFQQAPSGIKIHVTARNP